MALVGYDLIEELRDVAKAYREAEHARRSSPPAAGASAAAAPARGRVAADVAPTAAQARPRG